MNRQRIAAFLVAPICTWAFQAQANVVSPGIRLPHPVKEQEIIIKTISMNKNPSLMQVWIDRSNPDVQVDNASAPFLLTLPLVRIKPTKAAESITWSRVSQDKGSVALHKKYNATGNRYAVSGAID